MPSPRPLPHRHRITESLAALSLAVVLLTVLATGGSSRATDAQSASDVPVSVTPAAGGGR